MKWSYIDRYGDELVLYHSTHFDAFRQIISDGSIRTPREVDLRQLPNIKQAGSFRELIRTARMLYPSIRGYTNIYLAPDPYTAKSRSPYPSHVIFELHLPESWVRHAFLLDEIETVEGIKRIPLRKVLRIISRSNRLEQTKEILNWSKRFSSIQVVEISYYS